jgi:hypothetical protein
MLWHYILIGLVCLIAGFWLGSRHGRRVKRDALSELNTNSLSMLETKSRFNSIESQYADYQRKEILLKMTLQQLKTSNAQAKDLRAQALRSDTQVAKSNAQIVCFDAHVKKLQQDLVTLNKQQNLNQTFLKLKAQRSRTLAVQSHSKAIKATSLARRATSHLKLLENVITSRHTLSTSDPKSYGVSDQSGLSVFDPPRQGAEEAMIKQVPNRDSVRLAKLSSSNGATGPLN